MYLTSPWGFPPLLSLAFLLIHPPFVLPQTPAPWPGNANETTCPYWTTPAYLFWVWTLTNFTTFTANPAAEGGGEGNSSISFYFTDTNNLDVQEGEDIQGVCGKRYRFFIL